MRRYSQARATYLASARDLPDTPTITEGQYGSPKRKRDGSRNRYYDYLREVVPGDVVLYYASGAVRAPGQHPTRAGGFIDNAGARERRSFLGHLETNLITFGTTNENWPCAMALQVLRPAANP